MTHKKKTIVQKSKHCEWNHMTLAMIVGGVGHCCDLDTIYYAISNDIFNDDKYIDNDNENKNKNEKSIWKLSEIHLPFWMNDIGCVLTETNTIHPKLIVIGGKNPLYKTQCHFQFNLCDIIGQNHLYFMFLDLQKVTHIIYCCVRFFFCVCVFFVFFQTQKNIP